MAGKVTSYAPQIKAKLEAGLHRNLETAGIYLEGKAKELVSVGGTGVGANGNLIYGANPSQPGEPPHVQTGHLRASITHVVIGLICRVGTGIKYGRWLELGTKRMKARPWLRRALHEQWATLQRIVSRPIR